MKRLKKVIFFCNIIIITILILLCFRHFYLINKNNELEKLNVEYTKLTSDIEDYTNIKNEYFILEEEGKLEQNKIDELKTKRDKLNNEINDYYIKIDKLNKALGYSK